ncbi:MAG: hypothetical protein K2Q21_12725 [Chitinophagaceae bacterium]|nr:hypothetical protein [Chitinophagaceae bacterium]
MQKILLYLTFSVLLSVGAFAQTPPPAAPEGPNLQGIKIAFITRHLSLTTEEAQKFWPLYFDYGDKIRTLRKDQDMDELAFDEKMLEEKKKIKVELKKILGSESRANKALGVEREFNKVLKKELEDRGRALQQQRLENHSEKQQQKVDNHIEKQQQKVDNHLEKQQQKLENHKGPKNN